MPLPIDFNLKRGNLLPALNATLKYSDGTIINLTGATVKFFMRPKGSSTVIVNASCSVVSATAGTVQYNWQAGETDTVGNYEGEFQITFGSGSKLSVPNNALIQIFIMGVIA